MRKLTRDELVKALRCCEDEDCMRCPVAYQPSSLCRGDVESHAADMLENHASDRAALVAEIEKLRKQVRHGRWLKIEERMVLAYNTHFPMTITSETCSECNVRSGFLGKKGYVKDNSCPNCGAKMDGDDHA